MADNPDTAADAHAAENEGGESKDREDAVRSLIALCSRENVSIPREIRSALLADDNNSNDPSPERDENDETPIRASGEATVNLMVDSDKPVLHRTSSMPGSPPSSIFYRSAALSKSSRSMRFDLDDDGSGDDESGEVPTSAMGDLKSLDRTHSLPLPSSLYGYPDTELEQQQAKSNVGMAYQVPAGEAQPLLLTSRKPIDDVEQQPLIPAAPPLVTKTSGGILRRRGGRYDRTRRMAEERRLTRMAAAFLADYTTSQAPTLAADSDYVTEWHLFLHSLRFSNAWRAVMGVATACLFLASCYEGGDGDDDWQTYDENSLNAQIRHREKTLLVLTFVPVSVYAVDMIMLSNLFGRKYKRIEYGRRQSKTLRFASGVSSTVNAQAFLSEESLPVSAKARKSRAWLWAFPLAVFLVALSIETLTVVVTRSIMERRIWSSAFKPVVFFYASSRSRNALDAMNRVARIVTRVIFIELFLIFSFAAVACQLYGDRFESFSGLPISFLSMFQLSTTVVNPSMWMGVYAEDPPSAIFFVTFLIVSVFYLHSLVLSVVFQSYMDGMRIIREHAEIDREKNLELAFETLYRINRDDSEDCTTVPIAVSCKHIQRLLILMRPHYNSVKIQTLVNIVDPAQAGSLDYNTFRLKVPKALNTSVRSTRPYNPMTWAVEVLAAFVAVVNLVYVVLASSNIHAPIWTRAAIPTGFVITSLGILEILIRLIPMKLYRMAEAAKPSFVFDGLSICAAIVSLIALVLHGLDYKRALDYLFTGRAIDMIRCLRLNKEARGIVKRSSEVLPALVGPLALLITSVHLFAYLGMLIWGGEVIVGNNPVLTPKYDLNNFNDYVSGLITMFQVLVVNDWHAVAEVFILPYHMSNVLVYPFFVVANLINVSVLLNVMIAFFVGAFVTKTSGKDMAFGTERRKSRANNAPLSNGVSSSARVPSSAINHVKFEDEGCSDKDVSQVVTVTERQEFDNIMRTVAGDDDDEDDAARLCTHVLELFEGLSPVREKVGYLVSCQQSKSRYGNQRFQNLVHQAMDVRTMHGIVSEMHSELATLPDGHKRTVRREFPLPDKASLEITASLLEEGSSISLFVARICEDRLSETMRQ